MDHQRSRIGLLIGFVFGFPVSIFLVFLLTDYVTITTISIALVIGIAVVGLFLMVNRSRKNDQHK